MQNEQQRFVEPEVFVTKVLGLPSEMSYEEFCDYCGRQSAFQFDGASCDAGRDRCLVCGREPTPSHLVSIKDCKKCAGVKTLRIVPGRPPMCSACGNRAFSFAAMWETLRITLFALAAILVVSFVLASLIWGSISVSSWLWSLFI